MSQQSNPATLREALSELRCVADNLYMNLKAAAQFNPEGFNTPALEQVFQRFKTAAAKSVEIEAALAASGTEAAPTKRIIVTHPSQMSAEALDAGAIGEYVDVPAQAAASPEGEGREADYDSSERRRHRDLVSLVCAVFLGAPIENLPEDCRAFVTHALALRQSAAPSGGDSRALTRIADGLRRMRDGDRSGMSAQHMLEIAEQALAQESKTGAVTETK